MELEEEIYVNIEDLDVCRTKHHGPEKNETKPVRSESVAKETETWRPLKAAAACLCLLCFLLLTAVIGVGVQYSKDFSQLTRELANHTAERDQLLARYQNLTNERDQLQTSYTNLTLKLNKVKKKFGTCPNGWKQFGCTCYLLHNWMQTWSDSKQTCSDQGANLVIIRSYAEMVFLNKLGTNLKFWIGLSASSGQGTWVWTDGSSPASTHWLQRHYSPYYSQTQRCAAFNSFNERFSSWTVRSWSEESCSQFLRFVCEKPAEMS